MLSCAQVDKPDAAGSVGCLCHRPEIQSLTRRIGADLSRRSLIVGVRGDFHACRVQTRRGAGS